MLKHGEPNSLSVLNMRRLDFCPIHFQKMTFDLIVTEKVISDWLYENTDGRFFSGQIVVNDKQLTYCVGFENHSEASYFALLLPQINKYSDMAF